MWQKSFQVTTRKVNAAEFWRVLTNLNAWNSWDEEIEWTKFEGQLAVGEFFWLKPKGGPKTKLKITELKPQQVFSDVAFLLGAKMHTRHRLTENADGLTVIVEIWVTGLLAFLWAKIVAENQIKGGPAQVQNLIKKAMTVA